MMSIEKSKLLSQFFPLCIMFHNGNSLQGEKKNHLLSVAAAFLVLSSIYVTCKFCTNFSPELDWFKARETKYICALIKATSLFFISPCLVHVLSSAMY